MINKKKKSGWRICFIWNKCASQIFLKQNATQAKLVKQNAPQARFFD